jgi:hypothetical protein
MQTTSYIQFLSLTIAPVLMLGVLFYIFSKNKIKNKENNDKK